jgi:hypothetical protein
MKKISFALLVAAQVVGAAILAAQNSQTRTYVETLASPRLEGRLAGSNGERLAADYIVSELQKIGAKPLPGQADFRLPFEFTAGTSDAGSSLSIAYEPPRGEARRLGFGSIGRETARQVRALSFSDNGDVKAPAVFAGYGIVVPESQGFAYDSYATLDVQDKVVVVLRYFPEDADPKTKGILARYADLRYKAMAARQHGAKAMIVVTGPHSPNAGELAPMTFDTAIAGSGIVAVSITGEIADLLFEGVPDKPLAVAQKSLDDANPHATGFALPNTTVHVRAALEREKRTGHNVVAYLPATTPVTSVARPWVAIGAHYDHLGRGEAGNTLADKDAAKLVHVGADDNASGSAAVLSIAAALAKQPRLRNVLIGFWSGEELGLLGSAAFAAAPPVPLDRLAAYLNFDMVGRMQDNKLTVQAAGTSPAWAKLLEQTNVPAGFSLLVQDDPYQPTDVSTFNSASVPSLTFFTGAHADYHKPSDTPDKIDYEDLDRVVDFAAAIVRKLEDAADAPQFTKVEQTMQPGGGRAGARVYTGTIPDYSTEVKGLMLSGVVGGGPAEAAGLRKGDIIVEIAGQTITNIYDYTYALDVLKIGQAAKVIYLREGKRRETTLTPAARK